MRFLTTCAVCLVLSTSAAAEPITFGFTATFFGTHPVLSPLFGMDGVILNGTYTFDSDAIDSSPSPDHGSYHSPAPFGFSFSSGLMLSGGLDIDVVPLPSCAPQPVTCHDPRYIVSSGPFSTPDFQSIAIRLVWGAHDGIVGVINTDEQPLVPPDLTEFTFGTRIDLDAVDNAGVAYRLSGNPSNLVLVPEPSMLPLIGIGLLGVALARRTQTH